MARSIVCSVAASFTQGKTIHVSPSSWIELIRPQGFTGSIYMVRRLLRKLRPMRAAASTATLRFETAPGVQAQCDWASCGRHPNHAGCLISVYAFVMMLGFSRAMFVKFTTSMSLGTLIECHRQALRFFSGVPKEVLYDNMKQVRIEAGKLNPAFVDFAAHHGFAVKTCRVRRARTKGKVERMVDYVKDNFLLGREFADLDDLNSQATAWPDGVANVRVHATTGHRPVVGRPGRGRHPQRRRDCGRAPGGHEAWRIGHAEGAH